MWRDNIRILSAAMVEKAKSGHPGGAMGGADFVTVLYTEFLRYDPDNMAYPYRDRFFLDPGHMSPMLYSVLSLAGYYTTEDLQSLRQWGSVTPGHPEVDVMRGVENTSGPLGQGHAMALGAAIAERFMAARFGEWMAHKTYAYISDGAVEEEISQGVGRIAGHLGLSNFIMYYDSNNIQLSTKVDEVDTENVAMKYEAWGWNVLSVDGHNINEIREALVAANSETERPTLIIGHTIMGKGARTTDGGSFEDKVSTHGQPLTAAGADFAATVKNLGGDPENPFAVFEESREAFAERREALRAWAAQPGRGREDVARRARRAGPQARHVPLGAPARDRLQVHRGKGRRCDACGVGHGVGRLCREDRKYDRGFGRPLQFGQDRRFPRRRPRLSRRAISAASSSRRASRS